MNLQALIWCGCRKGVLKIAVEAIIATNLH